MSTICFVTDQWPGEPDILSDHQNKPLVVRSCLDQRELIQVQPTAPWTHLSLVEFGGSLAAKFDTVFTEEGADAYLGSQWIGSTEV